MLFCGHVNIPEISLVDRFWVATEAGRGRDRRFNLGVFFVERHKFIISDVAERRQFQPVANILRHRWLRC